MDSNNIDHRFIDYIKHKHLLDKEYQMFFLPLFLLWINLLEWLRIPFIDRHSMAPLPFLWRNNYSSRSWFKSILNHQLKLYQKQFKSWIRILVKILLFLLALILRMLSIVKIVLMRVLLQLIQFRLGLYLPINC